MNTGASADDAGGRRYQYLHIGPDVRRIARHGAAPWPESDHSAGVSPPLLDELQDKLRVKFNVSAEDAAAIRAKLETSTELIRPTIVLDVVKDDPDDNRVLECAIEGHAEYIISGDRHLLSLKQHANIPILTAREFLALIWRGGPT